jgi:hypothetical protein
MYQRPLCPCAAFILSVALRSQSFAQKNGKEPCAVKSSLFRGGLFLVFSNSSLPFGFGTDGYFVRANAAASIIANARARDS